MKKVVTLIILVAIALSSVIFVNAAEDALKIKVEGKEVIMPDAQPFIDQNGRTLVPVRFITEAMGAKVDWVGSTQTVVITKDDTRIALQIGQNWAIVNTKEGDNKREFDTAAVLKDERTFVPLRFLSETMGASISWFADTKTVSVVREYTEYLEPADLIRKVCELEQKGEYEKAFAYFNPASKQWYKYDNYEQYKKGFNALGTIEYSLNKALEKGVKLNDMEIRCKINEQSKDTLRVVYGLFGKNGNSNAGSYECRILKKINGKWYMNHDDEFDLYTDRFKRLDGI